MKAYVLAPTNNFIGKFPVASVDDIPAQLGNFLAKNPSIPLNSYVEAGGRAWTIVSLNPLELREGIMTGQATFEQPLGTKLQWANKVDYARNETKFPERQVLRALVIDAMVRSSILSLVVWGAINLGVGFLSQNQDTSSFGFLSSVPAILGILMLVSAIVGVVTRNPIVAWCDAALIITVGVWNLFAMFSSMEAARERQQQFRDRNNIPIKMPNRHDSSQTFWLILGIGQICWGARQGFRVANIGPKPNDVSIQAKTEGLNKFQALLNSPFDPAGGFFVAKMREKPMAPVLFYEKEMSLLVLLMPDRGCCIEFGLSRYFEFLREHHKGRRYDSPASVTEINGSTRNIHMDVAALDGLNNWTMVKEIHPSVEDQEILRLKQNVALTGNDDASWNNLGVAYQSASRLKEAESAYRRALEVNPNRVEALRNLGRLCQNQRRYDEAVPLLEKLVELQPNDYVPYSWLVVICFRKGDDSLGLKYAELAYSLAKQDATAAANLAVAYHYNYNTEMRDKLTQEAIRLGYDSPDALERIYSGATSVRDQPPRSQGIHPPESSRR